MFLDTMEKSSYNEGTECQLDYYINLSTCSTGDTAYLYSHEDNTLTFMTILEIIKRSDNVEEYDNLCEDVLLIGEGKYKADTSAEFILDNDCYLVWFKYLKEMKVNI